MLLGMTFAPAQTRADVLYVANNGDGTASQATSAGAVSTFATGLSDACAAEYDGAGNLYVSGASGGVIYQVTKQGSVSVFVTGLSNPQAMAFDANGDLYVADGNGNHRIVVFDEHGKYIREFGLTHNRELGKQYGVEYAEAFHYIPAGSSGADRNPRIDEYIKQHAVPNK